MRTDTRDYSAAQILETTSVKSVTFSKYSRVATLGYQSCMESAERLLGWHSPALLVFYSDTSDLRDTQQGLTGITQPRDREVGTAGMWGERPGELGAHRR